ncbi:MAG: type II toxin-antitoxin system death-on-curing family toxin [Patescibacteria group bacterium]|jgi:death-on-curing protein
MVKPITLEKIQYIAFSLAEDTLEWDEPIPKFETRYPNILESCIATPFQKFERKNLYTGLIGKGAILFYLLIKNHPFQNSNKRIAVTSLLVFLYINDKWLKVDSKELYNFSVWIAQSPPKLKQEVIKAIEKFIKTYLVDFEPTQ